LARATHNGSFCAGPPPGSRSSDLSGRARLSYQQTAALFSEASGSATHDAEDGTGTPMLLRSMSPA